MAPEITKRDPVVPPGVCSVELSKPEIVLSSSHLHDS